MAGPRPRGGLRRDGRRQAAIHQWFQGSWTGRSRNAPGKKLGYQDAQIEPVDGLAGGGQFIRRSTSGVPRVVLVLVFLQSVELDLMGRDLLVKEGVLEESFGPTEIGPQVSRLISLLMGPKTTSGPVIVAAS